MTAPKHQGTHPAAWWFVLLFGLGITAGGVFGVWLQGPLNENGFQTAASPGEIAAAFILPTAVTTAGSLVVTGVILASGLTARWTPTRRGMVWLAFTVLVLVAVGVSGSLAVDRVRHLLH